MRLFYLFIFSFLINGVVQADTELAISNALKSYQILLKELDHSLVAVKRDCSNEAQKNEPKSYCSLKDFCSDPNIHYDAPVLYQNAEGGQIENEVYYQMREDIRSCLKEGHKIQIELIRDETVDRLKALHVKKIIAANKKLNQLADRYNQREAIQKVSSKVLEISLLAGRDSDAASWDTNKTSTNILNNVLSLAEKKSKVKLHPGIKEALVEIQYLKNNPAYLEETQAIEEAVIPEIQNPDPLYNWKLLTDEKAAGSKKALQKNRERMQEKTQEAYTLFEETQMDMIRYLEGLKNASNKDKMDRVIERVKTIRFTPPLLIKSVEDRCQKGPNAFYDPERHALTLCPQMLSNPKMEIIETMAHEMAHSFDSCALSKRMFKVKGPEEVEEAPFDLSISMKPKQLFQLESGFSFNDNVSMLVFTQDRMKYKDHPFSKTLSCLQDPKSLGAEVVNPDEIRRKIRSRLTELEGLGQNLPQNKEARYLNYANDHLETYLDYRSGCDMGDPLTNIGRSQLGEGFADKMASEVIARKLEKLSPEEAKRGMLEILLAYKGKGTLCSNESTSEKKLREFAEKEGCKDYYANYTSESRMLKGLELIDPKFDVHSSDEQRIERLFLAHPMIRKALNCTENNGFKYCE